LLSCSEKIEKAFKINNLVILQKSLKIRIMIILLFCLFIVTINQTIVSIAGPSILAELGGFKYYSWIFSGTALTAAICSPITGKLYDLYGPKIIIIFFLFICSL